MFMSAMTHWTTCLIGFAYDDSHARRIPIVPSNAHICLGAGASSRLALVYFDGSSVTDSTRRRRREGPRHALLHGYHDTCARWKTCSPWWYCGDSKHSIAAERTNLTKYVFATRSAKLYCMESAMLYPSNMLVVSAKFVGLQAWTRNQNLP
jgi:hypothetical protein